LLFLGLVYYSGTQRDADVTASGLPPLLEKLLCRLHDADVSAPQHNPNWCLVGKDILHTYLPRISMYISVLIESSVVIYFFTHTRQKEKRKVACVLCLFLPCALFLRAPFLKKNNHRSQKRETLLGRCLLDKSRRPGWTPFSVHAAGRCPHVRSTSFVWWLSFPPDFNPKSLPCLQTIP